MIHFFVLWVCLPTCTYKEKPGGREVTLREPVPGNFLFDQLRGLKSTPKITAFLSQSDGKHLQATCLEIRYFAETQLMLRNFVESDLEEALFYRLWGPYHGY